MKRVENKVILITGAGGGIGAEAARLAGAEGGKVVVTDIMEANAMAVADEIRKAGGQALGLKHDVVSETGWQEVVARVKAEFGRIDVLVNNAGVASPKNILEMDMAEWKKIQTIDQDSCVIGMKVVIPEMIAIGGGSIINISSIGGLVGMARTSPYTAAKGALRSLSKAVAVDFGKQKVRCNTVHPGIITTPMTAESMKDAMPYYTAFTQLPFLGEPKDIAYGILFLASDESRFMTGAELVIDGGWTAL